MASAGQPPIQAMQCVHVPFHTGRPPSSAMLFSGQRAAHRPHDVHASEAANALSCTSCGLCAARCPLNNIVLEGGRPVWKGECTHCMACIGGCPTEAIEYGEKSKGRRRYYLEEGAVAS